VEESEGEGAVWQEKEDKGSKKLEEAMTAGGEIDRPLEEPAVKSV
jgi:hypothetical protein